MIITGDGLNLIAVKPNDRELKRIFRNRDDLANMSEVRSYPAGTPTEIAFKIDRNNTIIGEVRFKNIRWYNKKAELSLIILKEYQGKGYGGKALQAIMSYAFDNMELHRLEAEVIEYNSKSVKLLEKFGFVKEGVLREAKYHDGKYQDIFRYGLLRTEYEKKLKSVSNK